MDVPCIVAVLGLLISTAVITIIVVNIHKCW